MENNELVCWSLLTFWLAIYWKYAWNQTKKRLILTILSIDSIQTMQSKWNLSLESLHNPTVIRHSEFHEFTPNSAKDFTQSPKRKK